VETSTKLFIQNKKCWRRNENEKKTENSMWDICFRLITFYSWNASIGGRGWNNTDCGKRHMCVCIKNHAQTLYTSSIYCVYTIWVIWQSMYCKTVIQKQIKKFFLCLINYPLRHEVTWLRECIDPRVLELGTRWKWVASFKHRPLYPRGKSPRYPSDRSLGGPQNQPRQRGGEKNLAHIWTRSPNLRPFSP
jgi:hypothetical protein